MADVGTRNGTPRDEIERLEAQIETLAALIENCRKFILAARIAVAGGGGVLVAMLIGAIRPDLAIMAAAMVGLIGGIVVWGSNASTAKEAAKEITAIEGKRAALIGQIDLRVVGNGATLH